MRIVLVVLLVLHGLIHLIGVSRAGPATSRIVAGLWVVACAALVGAGGMLLFRADSWWLVAAAGVVLSQALIISAWHDAKFGTVANVLVALGVVVAWGDTRFSRETDDLERALLARVPEAPAPVVTAEEVAALPAPVARWLSRAGVVGKPRVRVVRLRQRGGIRLSPEQSFMDVDARQIFTVDEPGFVWRVRLRMYAVVPVLGRDTYQGGRGRMRIEAAGLWPIVDATGDTVDQGALLRYLGEMVWFPSAALSPYIRWEAVDADTARATMTYGGVSASGELRFADDGRVLEVRARRYMDGEGGAKLVDWVVPVREWRVMHGVRIPVAGDVIWRLPEGDFSTFRWEIADIEYDPGRQPELALPSSPPSPPPPR
jgi:hypothetical protein